MLNLTRMVLIAAALPALALQAGSATAEVYVFNFSGQVTSAENFRDYPDLPVYNTHPGEAYYGSFSFDTDKVTIEGDNTAVIPLDTVNFALPDENFSEDFSGPEGELRSDGASGATNIFGGRPDYLRELEITLSLPPSNVFNPETLYGRSGPLEFVVYDGNGFRIKGDGIVAPVPEPATWALMTFGVILAGAASRRRQSSSGRISY